MNKTSLIQDISSRTGFSKKDTELAVNTFIECVQDSLLKGEKVQLVGFGTFDVKRKVPRPGRNPKKPEIEITIPASNVPCFKPSKNLKNLLNE